MTEIIDRYLLYRIQVKKDSQAFASLYDRYVTSIYRFVVLKLPKKEDAQDVTAEVFTKFWQHIQQQKPVRNTRAFLYQIARNLIVDFYRNQKHDEMVESVTFDEQTASSFSDASRGKAHIEARTELALVLKQLDKLKEDYRDVLALRLIDGLTFVDIAAILGKQTSHVRVIFHRGMRAIKNLNLND